MISLPDRTETVRLIREAIISGAGKSKACKEVGINLRTFNRWTSGNGTKKDLRPNAKRPAPANKLNDEEKAKILEICNSRSFRSLPPTQIVPALADRGIYLASESTFYRVLKEAGQNHHRGRSSKPRKRIPQTHCAQRPCQVWTWDITWLPGPIKGIFLLPVYDCGYLQPENCGLGGSRKGKLRAGLGRCHKSRRLGGLYQQAFDSAFG